MISSNTEPGGRFVAQQQSLRDLIALAYKVRESQIIGGPAWIGSDRFDVNAKATRELPPFSPTGEIGPLERMLQALLADRFKLVAHRETREMPIFALVPARSDRRLGEKLRPTSIDCAAQFAERARAGQPGPSMAGDRPTCGMVVSPWSIRIGGGPLSQLTMVLTQMTNRFVVDQTGLTGNYDVDLQWTPQGLRMNRPPGGDGRARWTTDSRAAAQRERRHAGNCDSGAARTQTGSAARPGPRAHHRARRSTVS